MCGFFVDRDGDLRIKRVVLTVVALILFVFPVVGTIIDALEIVSAGHKGVIINSPSGPSNEEINEGYQWSIRYVWADIQNIEWRTQTVNFVGHDEADDIKGSVQVITNDSVPIFMDLSVIYHIQEDMVADLILENGIDYRERIIYPYVRSISRGVASHYNALDIIGDKRIVIEIAISQDITDKLLEKYLVVEGVAMRDVRIPENLANAIITKKVAEQNVLTQQYNLIAQQYIANRTIIDTQANATALIIKSTAQAEAVTIVMNALNSSSADNQTKDYLSYLYIQALTDPNSRIKYIIIPSDGGVPILLEAKEEG